MNVKPPLEVCVVCDNETGKSGRGEDSIYRRLNFICPSLSLQMDDEIGPLCSECEYVLHFVGFIDS